MRDHTLEELLADIRERKDVVVQQELNLIDDVVIMVKEELCVLGNLCLETVEEAIAMVPSIEEELDVSTGSYEYFA
ncbi:hypothetical protein JHK82_021390 [Glycine max]|nr:hypothetical protein JHK82_021390 [Glycine max]